MKPGASKKAAKKYIFVQKSAGVCVRTAGTACNGHGAEQHLKQHRMPRVAPVQNTPRGNPSSSNAALCNVSSSGETKRFEDRVGRSADVRFSYYVPPLRSDGVIQPLRTESDTRDK